MTDSQVNRADHLDALGDDDRSRFLAETIPVQIWTALPNGQLDYVTYQTAYQLGSTPEQLLREGWLNVVHADDAPRVVERWENAIATGETYEVEFRLRLRDGVHAWHLGRAVPQRDDAGNVVRWFGTNTNIEQQLLNQRQIEKLLKDVEVQAAELRTTNEALERVRREAERARDRVVDILESTQDAFFAVDRDFRITFVNRNQEIVSGLSRAQTIGCYLFDVFPVTKESKFWTEYHRARDEKIAVHFEEYYAPLDLWAEVRAMPTPEGGVAVFYRDITKRKRSDSQAQTILQSITDGLVGLGKARIISFVNRHAERVLARQASDLLGKTLSRECSSLIGPEVESVLEGAFTARTMGSVSAYSAEQRRWYEVHVYPAPEGGALACFRDVTERRREAEALRDNTALLMGISNSTGDVVFAKDRDGKMRFANPAALALIGKSAADVLGRTDAEFLEDEAAARAVMENDRRVMETGVAMDLEEVVPLPTGESRVWLSRKMPNRDEQGNVVGVLGVSRDITELRRAFERTSRLYEIAAAYSTAATSAEVMQVAVDLGIAAVGASAGSLYLLSADQQFLEVAGMVGYPEKAKSDWARFPLTALVPIAEAARTGKPQYISSAKERTERYPALAPLTAIKHTQSSACIPLTIGGRTLGTLGLSFDERGGDFSSEEQEFMVSLGRQCALALERARLFDQQHLARETAEHAGRMKDEFLTTLSHELRTPLNAIVGWATVLASRPSDEAKVRHGLATIQRNAHAQTQIIDDLLDMSAIVSGKVRLDVQRMNLADVLLAAVEGIRPTAEGKGIRLHTVIDPDAGPLFGDPNRLQQIFWNLLTNAMKFTPRGGRVEVVLRRVDSEVEATVADTGDGIRPDFLPYVFDRFRQADASTTRRHGGLGLGLALVKQLVELHGGTVRVESPGIGRGSSFTVKLPIAILHREDVREDVREPKRVESRRESVSAPVAEDHLWLRGLKVLVVDDEADARELVEHILVERGSIVRTARSAAEAIKSLETEWPDVLVSDIGMPVEDGHSLIAKVRALEATGRSRMAALALTAYARTEDRMNALRAGFDMHVVKPIEPEELLMVVASLARRTVKQS